MVPTSWLLMQFFDKHYIITPKWSLFKKEKEHCTVIDIDCNKTVAKIGMALNISFENYLLE
jgi:hypothetical protein